MTGTQISDMTISATIPEGGYVPFVITSAEPGFSLTSNYIYDLGTDLLTRVSYTALAAAGGAALVGSTGPSNVQADIDARPTSAALAASSGAGLVGAGETNLLYQIQATPAFYGVVDDPNASIAGTAVDQAVALQAWLDACVTNKWTPYAPHPIRVFSSATISFVPTVSGWNRQSDLRMSNVTLFSTATTGFAVGSAATAVDFAVLDMPNVIRQSVDWTGTKTDIKAAVVIYNAYKCTINRGLARFFTKGYLFYSKGAGISTNTINGGQMGSCRYGEVFLCDGADAGLNYCNENTIVGSDYIEFSTTAAETGDRIGTVFAYINGGYRGANNNRFFSCSYQGIGSAPSGQSFAVLMDGCGAHNYWYSPRWESGDGPFMRCDGKAAGANAAYAIYNEVVAKGYDEGTADQHFGIEQVGGAFGNIYRGIRSTEDQWDSGDLRDAVYSGGGAGVYRVANGFYLNDAGSVSRQLDLLSGFYNNIHGPQFTSGGVFARFDTTKIKTFMIQGGFLKGFEGRLFVEAFDASGARLTGTTGLGDAAEMYVKSAGLAQSATYGGGYISQSDNSESFAFITVRDDVASIGIAYVSGTANVVCSRFSVRGFATYNNAALEVITGGVRQIDPLWDGAVTRTASANPATSGRYGFYAAGQHVGNSGAIAGQPSGWVCTTGGALGWPYANSTAFSVPGTVVISDSGTKAYYVKTPGTTSGAGTGPSGTTPGTDYTDGTVVFRYIGPKAAFAAMANVP